jgi:hypothetical protein
VINAKVLVVKNTSFPCLYILFFHIFLVLLNGILDFIGPINLASSIGHVYILTTIDYLTKWVEVVPLRHARDEQVIHF